MRPGLPILGTVAFLVPPENQKLIHNFPQLKIERIQTVADDAPSDRRSWMILACSLISFSIKRDRRLLPFDSPIVGSLVVADLSLRALRLLRSWTDSLPSIMSSVSQSFSSSVLGPVKFSISAAPTLASSSSPPVKRVSVWPRAENCFPMAVSKCVSTPSICQPTCRIHLAFSVLCCGGVTVRLQTS